MREEGNQSKSLDWVLRDEIHPPQDSPTTPREEGLTVSPIIWQSEGTDRADHGLHKQCIVPLYCSARVHFFALPTPSGLMIPLRLALVLSVRVQQSGVELWESWD